MTLFRSEAKWLALSEAVTEVMFMIQLLRSMKISFKLLVMVRVDNVGTIFMTVTITNTSHAKQVIYIRYKYVNKYVDNGVVEIVFV